MTDVHGGGLGTFWEGVRPTAVVHGGDVGLLSRKYSGALYLGFLGIEVRMDVFRFGQLGLCPPSMIAASSIYLVLCVNVFWLQFRNMALSGQG